MNPLRPSRLSWANRSTLRFIEPSFGFQVPGFKLQVGVAPEPALDSDKVVAQICNLPYRRFATCWPPGSSGALPIENRRYSRLQICVTRQALTPTLSLALVRVRLETSRCCVRAKISAN